MREANSVPATSFSGSISSSCQSYGVTMAESGSPYYSSGLHMFEAVGRASIHKLSGTMGGVAQTMWCSYNQQKSQESVLVRYFMVTMCITWSEVIEYSDSKWASHPKTH